MSKSPGTESNGKILLSAEELLVPHPEDPVGENPCPVGHPAHRIWEDATRKALVESFRLQEEMLGRSSRNEAEHGNWFIELVVGKFQVWARRNLCIVRRDADARAYEMWLESFLQGWLKIAESRPWPATSRDILLSELNLQLRRASKYWAANALESVIQYQRSAEGADCAPSSETKTKIENDQSAGLISFSSDQGSAREAARDGPPPTGPISPISSPPTMPDAIEFWEGTADRFAALNVSPESFNLTGTLVKSVNRNGEALPPQWKVQGGNLQRWESLAYIAGEFLDQNHNDFKVRWLEELLKDADWPERQVSGPTGLPEWRRTIPSLAVVSERRCRTLAMEGRMAATAKRRAMHPATRTTSRPDEVAPGNDRRGLQLLPAATSPSKRRDEEILSLEKPNAVTIGNVPASDGATPPAKLPKKRGRKATFSQKQLDCARQMKADGKSNNEIAKILYGTNTPAPAQRRSVPTTLRHHFRPK